MMVCATRWRGACAERCRCGLRSNSWRAVCSTTRRARSRPSSCWICATDRLEECMDPNAAGKIFPSYEFHVERGKIREFADAIGDPNPLYRDTAHAASKGFAGVVAP